MLSENRMCSMLIIVIWMSFSAEAALLKWSDDFETANSNWVLDTTWRETAAAYDGSYSLFNGIANGHHAIRSIGNVSSGSVEVTLAVYIRGDEGAGGDAEAVSYGITSGPVSAEAWDNFQVDIRAYIGDGDNKAYLEAWDGGTPGGAIEIAKQTWHTMKLVVRPDTVNGGTYDWYLNDVLQASNYDFRFDPTGQSTGFAMWHWASDNTLESFTDSVVVQVPVTATSPYPASEVCIPLDAILEWIPAADAISHNVYLGTNFNDVYNATNPDILPGRGNQSEANYDPGTLEFGAVYYWRIDEVSDGNIEKGDIWSFTTTDWYSDGYKLWIEDSMKRVFPDSRLSTYPSNPPVNISLARNEYESFQVVLLPEPDVTLCDITLNCSDLSKGTDVIAASNISWHQVGYVEITSNTYVPEKDAYIDDAAPNDAGQTGWWPDLLLDVDSFCMDSQYAQPIWVTVYVPKGTPAGDYTGSLTLTSLSGPPTDIPLTVTVYNFTLADGAGHYKTAFALREQEYVTPENYLQYADFTLQHRLNPDNIYRSVAPRLSDLEHFYEQGMNCFTILNVEYIQTNDLINAFLSSLQTSPYETQLRNMAQFYGYDEIVGETNFEIMRTRFSGLEVNYSDIERATTARMHPFIPPYGSNDPADYMQYYGVDRFVPLTVYYDYSNGQALRAASMEQWSYVCVGPDPWELPLYVNLCTFLPLIESRVLWWQNFQQNMDGFLYYQMLSGQQANGLPIDPANGPFIDWEHAPYNHPGDGCLIYPGVSGPISSVRLANIRDGLEDYEYLWMLEERAGSRQFALEKCISVVWRLHDSPIAFTHDSDIVRNTRDGIAQILGNKKASYPDPYDGQSVLIEPVLNWVPGKDAIAHQVYLGDDYNEVNNLSLFAGDFNSDGQVDFEDTQIIAQHWLSSPPYDPNVFVDIWTDGTVNYLDFAPMSKNWQSITSNIYKGQYDEPSYDPGTLLEAQTYYWRVDELDNVGTVTKGDVWEFGFKITWDAKDNWSDTSNPNGQWSYCDGAGNPITVHQTAWLPGDLGINQPAWAPSSGSIPGWFKSTGLSQWDIPVGVVACHAPAIIKWVSPFSGTVNISGNFWMARDSGRSLEVTLSHNTATSSASNFTRSMANSLNPFDFGSMNGGTAFLTRQVSSGDMIALSVYPEPGSDPDFLCVDFSITEAP